MLPFCMWARYDDTWLPVDRLLQHSQRTELVLGRQASVKDRCFTEFNKEMFFTATTAFSLPTVFTAICTLCLLTVSLTFIICRVLQLHWCIFNHILCTYYFCLKKKNCCIYCHTDTGIYRLLKPHYIKKLLISLSFSVIQVYTAS